MINSTKLSFLCSSSQIRACSFRARRCSLVTVTPPRVNGLAYISTRAPEFPPVQGLFYYRNIIPVCSWVSNGKSGLDHHRCQTLWYDDAGQ